MLTKLLIIQDTQTTTIRILIQWHNSMVRSDKNKKKKENNGIFKSADSSNLHYYSQAGRQAECKTR